MKRNKNYGYVHRYYEVGALCPTLVEPVMAVDVFPVDTFFSWSPVEGATHYRVFVRAEGETEYTSVGLSTTNSLVASVQLAATTEYQWYVVPLLLVGGTHVPLDVCSPFTSTFTTSEAPACPFTITPLQGDTVNLDAGGDMIFDWTDVPGVTSYNLYITRISDDTLVNTFNVMTSGYTGPFDFDDGEVYSWYVNPVYGDIEFDCSAGAETFTVNVNEVPYEIAVGFFYFDGTIAPTTKFYTASPVEVNTYPLYTDPHNGASASNTTVVTSWSPDGQWFIAGSDDGSELCNVYDGTTLSFLTTLAVNDPRAVAWSPDSTKLVIAAEITTPQILACYDIDNANPALWTRRDIVHNMGIPTSVDVNSTYIGLSSITDPDFRLYDWATLTPLDHGQTMVFSGRTIRFNPDETNNEFVVSGSTTSGIQHTSVWRVEAGPTLVNQGFSLTSTSTLTGAYSLTGNRYVVVDFSFGETLGEEQSLLVYDTTDYSLLATIPFVFQPASVEGKDSNRGANCLAISGDGKLAVVGHSEYCFSVVNLETYEIVGGFAIDLAPANLYFVESVAIKGGK